MTTEKLKLVVLYDGNRNEYSIAKHNETVDDSQAYVDQLGSPSAPGTSIIVLDQSRRHRASDPEQCRACRDIVARTAHLSPQPKFVRRKQP